MCGTMHLGYRALRSLVFAVLVFAGGYVAARCRPSCSWACWQHWFCRAIPSSTSPSQKSELEDATATREELVRQLSVLRSQQRDAAQQLRLLQAEATIAGVLGRADAQTTQRRLAEEMQGHARRLAETDAQIETTSRLLRRLDGLVLDLQRDGTPNRATRDTVRHATELLWKHDPGQAGPNARVPDSDWRAESGSEKR